MPASSVSPAEPGGTLRMKSAAAEPLCGAPILVTEATRSSARPRHNELSGHHGCGRCVDFAAATDSGDFFNLLKQLFTTGFGGIQLADFGGVDLGTIAAQGRRILYQ